MGYTHYWTFKKSAKGKADETEALYQKAIKDIQHVALEYNAICSKLGNLQNRLSGYTAHAGQKYGGICINGKKNGPQGQDLSHEEFILREHYSQNLETYGSGVAFCKTAQKPYDAVVVASLIILKHRLGALIDVSSDGRKDDWAEGLALAKSVLGLKNLKIPLETECCKTCNREL